MNTKKIILASLLLAIGFILHSVMPGLPLNMKPDAFLSMMFIAILICDDYKMTLLIGLASGFLTAMTTTFPYGQIPNIIDKIITSHLVYLMLVVMKDKLNNQFKMIIVSIIGTLISGSVFLGSALLIFGLPAPFTFNALFVAVVLPATAANAVVVFIVCNAVTAALKRTAYKLN